MKEELSSLKYETLTLQRTEDIIKGRHKNVEELLKQKEKNVGIDGFY